jgi:hypothetical protein
MPVTAIPECAGAIDGRQTSWRLKLSVKLRYRYLDQVPVPASRSYGERTEERAFLTSSLVLRRSKTQASKRGGRSDQATAYGNK